MQIQKKRCAFYRMSRRNGQKRSRRSLSSLFCTTIVISVRLAFVLTGKLENLAGLSTANTGKMDLHLKRQRRWLSISDSITEYNTSGHIAMRRTRLHIESWKSSAWSEQVYMEEDETVPQARIPWSISMTYWNPYNPPFFGKMANEGKRPDDPDITRGFWMHLTGLHQ